jgi:hypothetical protein
MSIMPNTTNREVFWKHRRRKRVNRRKRQEQIAQFAKKKTREALHKLGRLPKIAMVGYNF